MQNNLDEIIKIYSDNLRGLQNGTIKDNDLTRELYMEVFVDMIDLAMEFKQTRNLIKIALGGKVDEK